MQSTIWITESEEAKRDIKQTRNIQYVICHEKSNITFVLTENKTLVMCFTGTFLIRYDHRNYSGKLNRLREMILSEEIKSMVDLVGYCEFRPGTYRNQMSGLELVPTKLERHI